MQEEYDCFYFVADWHALTSNYQDTKDLADNVFDVMVNWLSAGLNPDKSTLFIQSLVPEHAVLHLLLSMTTPIPWLERVPTYKEKQQQVPDRDLETYGFLGYPVLQSADILIYRAHFVPVGQDQLPHLELTREIARRFHDITKKKVFVEPQAKMSEVPKLLGTDNRKMSKTYNNAIYLSDSGKEIERKIGTMITDPQRVRRTDPGDPDVCNVFSFHKIFSSKGEVDRVNRECRTAGIGCTDCKKLMAKNLLAYLRPLMENRRKYLDDPETVYDIFLEGSKKAQTVARATLDEVEEALGIHIKRIGARTAAKG
jgi:tryptophanyl-tRNA synthetase